MWHNIKLKKRSITGNLFDRFEERTYSERGHSRKIARLLLKSDRTRALETLEEALAEARRIDDDDANRPRVMIGIASQFLTTDSVRPWEVAAEAVKAANAVETLSGMSPFSLFP